MMVGAQVSSSRVFRREGFDIHLDASISFTQAALGGEIKIPGLAGPIMLKVWGPIMLVLDRTHYAQGT